MKNLYHKDLEWGDSFVAKVEKVRKNIVILEEIKTKERVKIKHFDIMNVANKEGKIIYFIKVRTKSGNIYAIDSMRLFGKNRLTKLKVLEKGYKKWKKSMIKLEREKSQEKN